MNKSLLSQAVILLSFFLITPVFSQSSDYLTRAYDFIKTEYGLGKSEIGELKIKNQYISDHNKVTHVYLTQAHNGVEIFGTSINLAFLANGEILTTGHRLTILDSKIFSESNARVSAPEAIGIVARDLGITTRAIPGIA